MNRLYNFLCAALTTSAFVVSVIAQTPPESKSSQSDLKRAFAAMIEKTSAPTEAHKALAVLVGEFDQQSTVRMRSAETLKWFGGAQSLTRSMQNTHGA